MHSLANLYAPIHALDIDDDDSAPAGRGRYFAPVPVIVSSSRPSKPSKAPARAQRGPARKTSGRPVPAKTRASSATSRVAVLEAQLAAVTAERNALAAKSRPATPATPTASVRAGRSPLERALRAAGISEKRIQLELAKSARKAR